MNSIITKYTNLIKSFKNVSGFEYVFFNFVYLFDHYIYDNTQKIIIDNQEIIVKVETYQQKLKYDTDTHFIQFLKYTTRNINQSEIYVIFIFGISITNNTFTVEYCKLARILNE